MCNIRDQKKKKKDVKKDVVEEGYIGRLKLTYTHYSI